MLNINCYFNTPRVIVYVSIIHLILKNASFFTKKKEMKLLTEKKYDQAEYNRRWAEKNKERRRYLSYRSSARSFIKNYASQEDLEELKDLIEKKKKN